MKSINKFVVLITVICMLAGIGMVGCNENGDGEEDVTTTTKGATTEKDTTEEDTTGEDTTEEAVEEEPELMTFDDGLEDLAFSKPVVESSYTLEDFEAVGTAVNDGDAKNSEGLLTAWKAEGYPNDVTIDLGDLFEIQKFVMTPSSSRAYQYKLEGSIDGKKYEEILNREDNAEEKGTIVEEFDPVVAQFVKLTITGISDGSTDMIKIYDLQLRGINKPVVLAKDDGFIDVAVGRPVTHSAAKDDISTGAAVVDGNTRDEGGLLTGWRVEGYPQELVFDLEKERQLVKLEMIPWDSRPYQYKLEVSADGNSWTEVLDKTDNSEYVEIIGEKFSPVMARYAKLTITGIADELSNWITIQDVKLKSPAVDVAYGKNVTESLCKDDASNGATVVDGKTRDDNGLLTGWRAEGYPNHVEIDLGAVEKIGKFMMIPWDSRPYQYKVEVSTDGQNYTQVLDRTDNTEQVEVISEYFPETDARFVKVTITGIDQNLSGWITIQDIKILSVGKDKSYGKNVTESLCKDDASNGATTVDGSAVDENGYLTGWRAEGYPNFVEIDLGEVTSVSTFMMIPWDSRPYQYKVEVSTDGQNYTEVLNREDNTATDKTMIEHFTPVDARYVKVTITGIDQDISGWITIQDIMVIGK